jgi:isochorismate pyruvate lyase
MVAWGLTMSTTRADNETNLQALQDEMSDVRRMIDEIDDELVALLAKRQRQIERAARVMPGLGIPARAPERVDEVLARVLGASRRESFSVELAMTLWTNIIEWAIQYEERLMGDKAPKGDAPSDKGRRS